MVNGKKNKIFELKKDLFFVRLSILMGNSKKNSLLKDKKSELKKMVVLG